MNKLVKRSLILALIIFLLGIITASFIVKDSIPENAVDYTETMYIEKKFEYSKLELAFSYLDQVEKFTDGTSNPIVLSFYKDFVDWVTDTEVPWCSAFVNTICASTGYEYTGKLTARSWEHVGVETKNPIAGDIVVFWRGSPDSWKGHVAFYLNETPDGKYINVVGGNQGNAVSVAKYPKSRLLCYRRLEKIIDFATFTESDSIQSVIELKLE